LLATLVDHGADVNAAPWIGSPLHWATNFGHVEVMAWLLDHGANIHSTAGMPGQGGATPLHTAAWAERPAPVELLLARGADPARRDIEHGGTPLDYARHRGADDVAQLLASVG
jgi:ankyrin repeat protein